MAAETLRRGGGATGIDCQSPLASVTADGPTERVRKFPQHCRPKESKDTRTTARPGPLIGQTPNYSAGTTRPRCFGWPLFRNIAISVTASQPAARKPQMPP